MAEDKEKDKEKEKAPEEQQQQPKRKFPKPKMSIVLIILLVIFGVVLAGGISFFVAAKIAGERTGPVTVITKREPGQPVSVGDPKDGVVVNIGGITGRYLKIVMTLEVEPTKDEAGKALISELDKMKIQDGAIRFLRSQKIDAFVADRQDELKSAMRKYLNELLGSERILNVFITNAVIQ